MQEEEYHLFMKRQLSNPQLIDSEGDINHQYFMNKKGHYWGQQHYDTLAEKSSLYGIANYSHIKHSHHLLADKSDIELELRTAVLLGTSDISDYVGLMMTRESQCQAREENEERGRANNKWRFGVYLRH